jgi:indolepyruvate ferredoxin oxidoreductase
LLAGLKGLRGTSLDVFGYSAERRQERQLIEDYRQAITQLLPSLSEGNLPQVLALAALPEDIRGFGHVKHAHLERVLPRWTALAAEIKASA